MQLGKDNTPEEGAADGGQVQMPHTISLEQVAVRLNF